MTWSRVVRHGLRRAPLYGAPLLAGALALAWPQSALSHGSVTTTVLFDREIVRILDAHCVMCHSDRSLSFPLSTYEETWLRGRAIRTEVLRRHMPPWPAVAGYGAFANDNGLTVREAQFMVSWVEGLGPRNAGGVFLNVARPDVAPPPPVRAIAHTDHWQLGTPDLTRPIAGPRIDAGSPDVVRRVVVDSGLSSPRQLRGIEYMPGDRRIVRAATFSVEGTGQWLGSWTPWYGFVEFPAGVAARLPARARIVAEVSYRGTTEPAVDRGTLGLFFASGPRTLASSEIVLDAVAGPSERTGPTSVKRLVVTTRIAADTRVWALRPDVVPGLTSIEVSARTPDGQTEILLFARDPSTTWPTPFILKEPRLIRQGATLSVVARTAPAATARRLRMTVSRY